MCCRYCISSICYFLDSNVTLSFNISVRYISYNLLLAETYTKLRIKNKTYYSISSLYNLSQYECFYLPKKNEKSFTFFNFFSSDVNLRRPCLFLTVYFWLSPFFLFHLLSSVFVSHTILLWTSFVKLTRNINKSFWHL